MRNVTLISFCFLFNFIFAQTETQNNNNYIIRGVNVIPINKDTILKNQMVIITGNKISVITEDNGKDFQPVERYTFIDAKNKYLMPSLADMHEHFPNYSDLKNYFTLNLLSGVTTIRSMRGSEEHLKIKIDKNLPQLKLYLSAPPITNHLTIGKKTADSIVYSAKSNGYDFIKVLSIKDSLSFIHLSNACKKDSLHFCGHGLSNISMPLLLKSGYSTIEHFTGYAEGLKNGEKYINTIINLTVKNNVFNCITEDYFELGYNMQPIDSLKNRKGLNYIPDTVKARWDKELEDTKLKIGETKLNELRENYAKTRELKNKLILKLIKKGGLFIVGADAGGPYSVPGFALIEEMKHHVKAGLSNYQILCAATINAAKAMNQSKKWGTVEINKEANLILLNSNPLEDINNLNSIEGVFLNSEFKTIKELEASLK